MDAGLSAEQLDAVVLVGGSTRIPAVRDLVKTLTGKEPNRTVNPDEVVALGAAIQGSLLSGEDGEDLADMLLLDALGTKDGVSGRMIRIVERNAAIPAREQTTVTTVRDNQTAVEVEVFQGEAETASDNKRLGTFRLADIPAAPAGKTRIVVAMEIDVDGILKVSACDQATGREAFISVTGASSLSKAEVNRLRKDAEAKATV